VLSENRIFHLVTSKNKLISIGVGTMNGIIKSIAVVAIISFFISACGGESSGESSGEMPTSGNSGLNTALLSDTAKRGHDIYVDPGYSCVGCHGLQGKGTSAGGPIDNIQDCPTCVDHATLTQYNDLLMPASPYNPASCTGACASDVSQFIIEGFVQGLAIPGNNTPPATPAINVNPVSGLTTTEAGGTATFTVSLNTLPTENVDITLLSDNAAEGSVNPTTLTFTTANWNQLQTVTVTGMDDAVLDGDIAYNIVTTAASNDVDYAAIDPADVAVTNTDNEVPPPGVITVDPVAGLTTSENGDAATFTIVLGTMPTQTVTIGLSSSNAAEGTVLPASVAFTSANYNVPQTITVTGVDDAAAPMVDGNIAYSIITAPAISADPSYSARDASDVSVTNTDNDVQPVISQFSVDQASVAFGGMVTLNWASDGDTCTAGGANPGNQWMGALLPTSMLTLTNLTTSGVNQFTLTCTKGGIDSVVATVDVTVAAAPGAPTVNLTANPAMNVPFNGSTTLTWTSTGAVGTCAAAGGWTGDKALNGTEVINNLVADTTFSLTCNNAIGTPTLVSTNVTVVAVNPALTFTVNNAASATVNQGEAVTLAWNPTDLQSCVASANPANAAWTGAKDVALATYSEVVANLQETTTFTLNCMGVNGANVTQNVTATVNAGDPLLVQGQIEYKKVINGASCETCHGTDGRGILSDGLYDDITDFVNAQNEFNVAFITSITMPAPEAGEGGMPSDCVDVADGNDLTNCATNVAKYMKNGFSTIPPAQ
jgi:mono/diheme cytochrome c family protein